MAGGVFTSQNKVRPGAYINFKSVPKPSGKVGTRGIATIPLELGWGPNDCIVEINSSDISDGQLINKIGYYGNEKEILPLREALKNSYKLLLFRIDTNGQRAAATIQENLSVVAKYPGIVGNRLSVVIKELSNKFEVKTLLDTKVMDSQIVSNSNELKNNAWIDFASTGEGTLTADAGIHLTNGSNGTVTTENYSKYLSLINNKQFNTMGVFTTDSSVKEIVLNFVKKCREENGKKIQAVINEYASANYEGIISVDQGYKTLDETVDVAGFVGFVTGLTAGSALNRSNTYSVIPGAIEIINPKSDEEIKSSILDGKLVLSFRQDESVVIETDINTFVDFEPSKGREFSKNRVIRTLDDINNTIKSLFEKTYLGKVDNNDNGRTSFKSDIISYMTELAKMGAINNFKAEDISISQGNDIDSVVVEFGVQPIDAMEKLYMTVSVR